MQAEMVPEYTVDHGSVTVAVLKEKFKDTLCIMYLFVLKH